MRYKASAKIGRFGTLALLLLCGTAHATESAARLPLRIGNHVFRVEVAATPQQREHGLMARSRLPADAGMLFVFENTARYCFWMRDTPLPLSIAFIDDNGRIATLADMKPNTDTLHCPSTEVRYALEVPQGGFKQRGIAAGARVSGLPR